MESRQGRSGEAMRQALFRGVLLRDEPSTASRSLVDRAKAALDGALGDSFRQPRSPEALLAGVQKARSALEQDASVDRIVDALLEELGQDPTRCLVDRPRLRAIAGGLHRLPAARAVFFSHRDTWYANPRAQINLWIPLFDEPAHRTFVFYPDVFSRSVSNTSSLFDLECWERAVGFQSSVGANPDLYPVVDPRADPGPAEGFSMEASGRLHFASAHLHQTLGHDDPVVRYSLDLRWVHRADRACGLGAPDPDNHSRGDTARRYRSGLSSRTSPGALQRA